MTFRVGKIIKNKTKKLVSQEALRSPQSIATSKMIAIR
jgi:hypothetical protein